MELSIGEELRKIRHDGHEEMVRGRHAIGHLTDEELAEHLAILEECRNATTCACPIDPSDPAHDIDDCFDAAAAAHRATKEKAAQKRGKMRYLRRAAAF